MGGKGRSGVLQEEKCRRGGSGERKIKKKREIANMERHRWSWGDRKDVCEHFKHVMCGEKQTQEMQSG